MEPNRIDELAKDPILGRVFDKAGADLKAAGATLAADQNNNGGNAGSSGMPTDNARFREVTQDRPNPAMPTYSLATPTPVIASDQAAIRDVGTTDLSWHRDLVKLGSAIEKGGPEQSKGNTAAQPAQGQAAQHEHTREPQGRGR